MKKKDGRLGGRRRFASIQEFGDWLVKDEKGERVQAVRERKG
jgi:hypothetical protein